MQIKSNYSLGFSLFEVVVYLAIFSTIMVTLLAIAAQSSRSGAKALAEQEVLHHSQFILERLRADVHASQIIDETALALNQLELTQFDGTVVVYSVSDNQLFRQQDGAAAVALTSDDITVATFSLNDVTPFGSTVHDISLSMTLETNPASTRPEFQANQTIATSLSVRL